LKDRILREARAERKTTEVTISVEIKIDGTGRADVKTNINFLDHLLVSLAKHSLCDLIVRAEGDLNHHICEDVALTLGDAVNRALKERKGIKRFGFAYVPMDDALARAAIDIGGRPYSYLDLQFTHSKIEDLATEDIKHFFESFAQTCKSNVHLTILSGMNDHHKAEATIKALAIALKEAVCYDLRRKGEIPSTKGVI
jgi:imidazoleglycerol-phosphate dehydratase